MKRPLFIPVALLLLMAMTLSGCGHKVSQRTYDKIHNGMTLSEVDEMMGFGEPVKSWETGAVRMSDDVMRIVVRGSDLTSFKVVYLEQRPGKEAEDITVTISDTVVTAKESKGL